MSHFGGNLYRLFTFLLACDVAIDFLFTHESEMKGVVTKHMLTNTVGLIVFVTNAEAIGSEESHFKDAAAWLSDKMSRLKLNRTTDIGLLESLEFLAVC
jgi:hypothetical protein